MANPPKQKGTGGEREVKNDLEEHGLTVDRTAPTVNYDLRVRGGTGHVIEALATRPDRGAWLVSITLENFAHLLAAHGDEARIEVKRYKRFAHHTIFSDKFGPR